MKVRTIAIFCLLSVFAIKGAHAEIAITEIYPAPSSGFEWVELCNTGPDDISLTSYTLYDASGKKMSIPDLVLAPQQYILATSSGILNNSGDTVTLSSQGTVIQDVLYDFSVSSEYSIVSCSQSWSKTLLITPGYENVPCTSPGPATTPFSALTPSLTAVHTPTPSILHVATPTPTSITPHTTRASPISFQKHHAPHVLAASTQPTPTTTTEPSTRSPSTQPQATSQPSQLRGIGMLVWTIGTLSAGLWVYTIVKRAKNRYTKDNDIPP